MLSLMVELGVTLELHLDSPTGTLVGTSPPVSAAKTTKYSTIKIASLPTSDFHTRYIIGRNTRAKVDEPLLHISRIQFQP
ncbi:carbohydrate-binding protein [Spirosoma flavum]|uniref:Uncharacterized protein n=1 Tax=Spirosoma flavum TaxID=2048557 RepID=A0ABW6ATN2_9BACT